MQVEIVQVRPWYHKPAPWVALGVVACLGFLALPHAQRAYYRWSEVRKMQRASVALERGDYKQALLNARGALATDAKHVEATRMMARIAEAVDSPDALKFRRQLDALQPGDTENLLGMAAHHLKSGNAGAAQQALRNVSPQDQTSARYYDLAAGVALAQKDAVSAEIYAAKAAKSEPANDEYALRLAALRLSSKTPEARGEALAMLQQLSEKTATRSRSLRVLVNDAVGHGETARALELAALLSTSADATFADKLAHLSTWYKLRKEGTPAAGGTRGVKQSDFAVLLEQVQKTAEARPEDLFQMLTWMNDHHMALLVPDWIATLPAESIASPPVCIGVADAYARASSWARLRAAVEKASWDRMEFLRYAYLSRALEGVDDPGGAATAWSRAVETAKAQPAFLETLARETAKWGWRRQNEEVLWKMAAGEGCPRWVVDTLWKSGLQRQNPAMLYKVSKLILQAEPKSLVARNQFISLALITGQEGAAIHARAEEHYKEHPDHIAVAAAHGFSLFLQGRAEEAVGIMAKFPREQLRQPALAFYQGMFLAGAGRPEEGEEFFRIGEEAPQFEELIAIRNFLRGVYEADAAERGGQPAQSAQAWQAALLAAQKRPQWLEILGRLALKWGRTERAGEAALKLADAGQCPPWATEPLWAASLRTGDPVQIQKVSKVILDANPKSLAARGNFITAALLAGKEGDAPARLAEALSREQPGAAAAAAPYAYALYRQGKSEQALTLLRSLDAQQRAEPRIALYSSLVLAATGHTDEAAAALPPNVDGAWFPEEKAVSQILRQAFDCRAADRGGNTAVANAAWSKAIAQAESRPDMLATLGRMAQTWEAPERAEQALWKLAEAPPVPRWVVDALVVSAERRQDSLQLYRATRLLRQAEPQNVAIRNRAVRLALLTGQNADAPDRLARELHEENPRHPEVVATYALALYQQGKTEKAMELIGALPPAQLRTARPALYYGIFLTSKGQEAKAREYLEIGTQTPLLPEEQALISKAEKHRASNER